MRLPPGLRAVALVWAGAILVAGAVYAIVYARVGDTFYVGVDLSNPSIVAEGGFAYRKSLSVQARLPVRVEVHAALLQPPGSNLTVTVTVDGRHAATLGPGGSYTATLGNGDTVTVEWELRSASGGARVLLGEVRVEPAPRGLALAAAMIAVPAALAAVVVRGGGL